MKHAEKYINGDSYNRSAGILLPVFSLPSPYGIGDMGEGAYRFVDMAAGSRANAVGGFASRADRLLQQPV